MEIITGRKQITKYQNQFIKRLKEVCTERIFCIVGNKGSSSEVYAYYSNKYDFWFASYKNDNRFWNAFGPHKPVERRNNSITVEINPPYTGINRRIGGAFGIDEKGNILLLHRGKIGGGAEGIGKQLFLNNVRGELISANDGGVENEFFVIGNLSSKFLPKQIANFVYEVRRIKDLKKDQEPKLSLSSDFSFTVEHSGISKIKRSGTTTFNWTHGIVVNALAKLLESKGYNVKNDRNRDLFIVVNGKIKKLFEVKVNTVTQSLYSAVGQLLIYSIPIQKQVDLILVIPDKLSKPVEKRLMQLGIKIMLYQWIGDEPVFESKTLFNKNKKK